MKNMIEPENKIRWIVLVAVMALALAFVGCDSSDSSDDDDNDDATPIDDDTSDDDTSDDDTSDDDTSDDDTSDDDTVDDDTIDDDTIDDDTGDDDTFEGPYYSDFQRYWMTMDEGYAYFIEKDVDWDAVYETYEPLARAETELGPFALLIAEMTAGLRDTHTWSSMSAVPPGLLPYATATGVCLQRCGAGVYVSRLTNAAISAGMELGDHVIALDGDPVDDVLAEAVHWEGCSTAQCCDFFRLAHVDRFSAGDDSVVYTIERGDATVDIELLRTGGGSGTCKMGPLVDWLKNASGAVLRYKPIDDDLGYLHLSTLSEGYLDTILAELDAALDQFAGRDGLIFDARYNHGGSDLTAMAVLARFLDQVVWPVAVRYKNGPAHDDFTPWLPEPVLAGDDPTAAPVVFLINGGCVSAADFFAAAAAYVPTFTLLGTTSCGATGAPKNDMLPVSGITYYYSQMQRKFLATGEQIEGYGIAPDVVVDIDPADLAGGIDSQLQAAIDLLRSR